MQLASPKNVYRVIDQEMLFLRPWKKNVLDPSWAADKETPGDPRGCLYHGLPLDRSGTQDNRCTGVNQAKTTHWVYAYPFN